MCVYQVSEEGPLSYAAQHRVRVMEDGHHLQDVCVSGPHLHCQSPLKPHTHREPVCGYQLLLVIPPLGLTRVFHSRSHLSDSIHTVLRLQDLAGGNRPLGEGGNQSDVTQRVRYDHELYLADPVLPAHSPEAGSGQDNGSEVLLLIQLLQTRVQVPALRAAAKDSVLPAVTVNQRSARSKRIRYL